MSLSARTRYLALAILALGTAACATTPRAPDVFRSGDGQAEDVFLTVENNDFRDATVYAYWNGMKDRVGMVTGKTSETFQMTWRSEEIEIEVDFVGGGGYRTEVVDVWRGDHLNFTILPGI